MVSSNSDYQVFDESVKWLASILILSIVITRFSMNWLASFFKY